MNANYSAAIVYNVDSNKVILEEVTLFNRLIFTFRKCFSNAQCKTLTLPLLIGCRDEEFKA